MSPKLLGVVVFLGGAVFGFVVTSRIRDSSLQGVSAAEVSDALYRDGLAAEYTLLGWFVTLVASIALAVAVTRSAARPQNERATFQLPRPIVVLLCFLVSGVILSLFGSH